MSREEANGRGASTREQLGIVKDEEGGHGNSIGGEGREWSGDESGASQSFMRAESSRAGDTSSAYETDDWDYMGREIMSNAISGLKRDGLLGSNFTSPASSRPITRGNSLVAGNHLTTDNHLPPDPGSPPPLPLDQTAPQLPLDQTVPEHDSEGDLSVDDAKARERAFLEISAGHPDLSLFGTGPEPEEVTRAMEGVESAEKLLRNKSEDLEEAIRSGLSDEQVNESMIAVHDAMQALETSVESLVKEATPYTTPASSPIASSERSKPHPISESVNSGGQRQEEETFLDVENAQQDDAPIGSSPAPQQQTLPKTVSGLGPIPTFPKAADPAGFQMSQLSDRTVVPTPAQADFALSQLSDRTVVPFAVSRVPSGGSSVQGAHGVDGFAMSQLSDRTVVPFPASKPGSLMPSRAPSGEIQPTRTMSNESLVTDTSFESSRGASSRGVTPLSRGMTPLGDLSVDHGQNAEADESGARADIFVIDEDAETEVGVARSGEDDAVKETVVARGVSDASGEPSVARDEGDAAEEVAVARVEGGSGVVDSMPAEVVTVAPVQVEEGDGDELRSEEVGKIPLVQTDDESSTTYRDDKGDDEGQKEGEEVKNSGEEDKIHGTEEVPTVGEERVRRGVDADGSFQRVESDVPHLHGHESGTTGMLRVLADHLQIERIEVLSSSSSSSSSHAKAPVVEGSNASETSEGSDSDEEARDEAAGVRGQDGKISVAPAVHEAASARHVLRSEVPGDASVAAAEKNAQLEEEIANEEKTKKEGEERKRAEEEEKERKQAEEEEKKRKQAEEEEQDRKRAEEDEKETRSNSEEVERGKTAIEGDQNDKLDTAPLDVGKPLSQALALPLQGGFTLWYTSCGVGTVTPPQLGQVSNFETGGASTVPFQVRGIVNLPSVVTWYSPPGREARHNFGNLPSVVSWFVPRPAVWGWVELIERLVSSGAQSRASADAPKKTSVVFAGEEVVLFEPENADEMDDIMEGFDWHAEMLTPMPEYKPGPPRAGRIRDFPSVVTWRPPPPRVDRKVDRSMSSAKVFAEDHSDESAAVLLQRTLRGMIDRVFFRKLMGIRSRKIAATVRKNTKVEPKPNVIDMIEPDGYLSRATQQKIIERGEPMDRNEVLSRAMKMKSRRQAMLRIEAPSRSGRPWSCGEARSVRWQSSGSIQVTKVGLYLYHRGEPVMTIVKSVRNLGKYIYKVPETTKPDDEYQILVIAEEPKLPEVHSFTETFSIVPPGPGALAKAAPSIPTFKILFPSRPNFTWACGSSYNISWEDSGSSSVVQIDVVRRDVFAFRIIGSLINIGGFQYAMPIDAPTGDGYQIRVRSAANKKAFALSVPFSIVDREAATAVPRQTRERPKDVELRVGTGGASRRMLEPISHTPRSPLSPGSPGSRAGLYSPDLNHRGGASTRGSASPHSRGVSRGGWVPYGSLGAPSGQLPGLVGEEEEVAGLVVRETDIPPSRMMRVAFGGDTREVGDWGMGKEGGSRAASRGGTAGGVGWGDDVGRGMGTRGGSRGGLFSREGTERKGAQSREGKRRSRTAEPSETRAIAEWGNKATGIMKVSAGTESMVSASLVGNVPPVVRARTVTGATRSRAGALGASGGGGGDFGRSVLSKSVASAASEFLSLRDAMFSHQIELLRDMGGRMAPLPPLEKGGGGADVTGLMGRYQPAFVPGRMHTASRGGQGVADTAEQWGAYKGRRADDAAATQAIEGLQTRIEDSLFHQPGVR